MFHWYRDNYSFFQELRLHYIMLSGLAPDKTAVVERAHRWSATICWTVYTHLLRLLWNMTQETIYTWTRWVIGQVRASPVVYLYIYTLQEINLRKWVRSFSLLTSKENGNSSITKVWLFSQIALFRRIKHVYFKYSTVLCVAYVYY